MLRHDEVRASGAGLRRVVLAGLLRAFGLSPAGGKFPGRGQPGYRRFRARRRSHAERRVRPHALERPGAPDRAAHPSGARLRGVPRELHDRRSRARKARSPQAAQPIRRTRSRGCSRRRRSPATSRRRRSPTSSGATRSPSRRSFSFCRREKADGAESLEEVGAAVRGEGWGLGTTRRAPPCRPSASSSCTRERPVPPSSGPRSSSSPGSRASEAFPIRTTTAFRRCTGACGPTW